MLLAEYDYCLLAVQLNYQLNNAMDCDLDHILTKYWMDSRPLLLGLSGTATIRILMASHFGSIPKKTSI